MPGPVSDAFDPEFGTAENAAEIAAAIRVMYQHVSYVLDHAPPVNIVELVRRDLPRPIPAVLTEKQWRLIRFALERAGDSL